MIRETHQRNGRFTMFVTILFRTVLMLNQKVWWNNTRAECRQYHNARLTNNRRPHRWLSRTQNKLVKIHPHIRHKSMTSLDRNLKHKFHTRSMVSLVKSLSQLFHTSTKDPKIQASKVKFGLPKSATTTTTRLWETDPQTENSIQTLFK